MAELDSRMLGNELDVTLFVALQVVLALIALVIGYVGRNRFVLILILALAVIAGGATVYQCAQSEATVRGRLEGRIPGQFLPRERGENFLAWVERQRWYSAGIALATVVGAGYLRYRSSVGKQNDTNAKNPG
jgi:hypothetical protein